MIIESISDKEYRDLPEMNYSRLKAYGKDPRSYYRKYIMKEAIDDIDEQERDAIRFGGLVDCILTSEQDLDHRYQIADIVVPTGNMLKFCTALIKNTFAATLEGVLQVNMETLYQQSYRDAGIKKPEYPEFREKFVMEGLAYYTAIRERGDRIVIATAEYEKACYLVEKLLQHPLSSRILGKKNDERYDVEKQLVVTGEVRGFPMKCKVDVLIIDKINKVVYPYDLKVTSSFEFSYLRFQWYLQLSIYTLILRQNFPGYEVRPMSFLACDRTMYYEPVLHRAKEINVEQGLLGFTHQGKKYIGVNELLDNLTYAETNNCFTMSIEAHKCKGILDLTVYE